MTLRVDRVVTSGTFSLDGGTWDVDNNIWLVGDDREVLQGLGGGDAVVLDPPDALADGATLEVATDPDFPDTFVLTSFNQLAD